MIENEWPTQTYGKGDKQSNRQRDREREREREGGGGEGEGTTPMRLSFCYYGNFASSYSRNGTKTSVHLEQLQNAIGDMTLVACISYKHLCSSHTKKNMTPFRCAIYVIVGPTCPSPQ